MPLLSIKAAVLPGVNVRLDCFEFVDSGLGGVGEKFKIYAFGGRTDLPVAVASTPALQQTHKELKSVRLRNALAASVDKDQPSRRLPARNPGQG